MCKNDWRIDMLRNVIIVNDSDFVSGGEDKVAIQTANELVQAYRELNVYFFSCNGTGKSTCLDKNIKQYCTQQGSALLSRNKLVGAINGICNFKFIKEFKKFLSKFNNNETIVHVHSWSKAVTSEVFNVCEKKKIKCILTLHDYFIGCPNGGFFNYQKNEICKFNPMSLKCITCNCDSRNYLFKVYRIIRQCRFNKNIKKIKYAVSISQFSERILVNYLNKNCRITRIYNPIDFDLIPKKSKPEKSNFFLYVGRVSKEKGVEIYCDAVMKADVNGIVIGDGVCKKELEKKYNNIVFKGWKNAKDVKEIMRNARCLIIPSKWYEGAPLTPLEAMQYGIPCISSANNATVDYLENGVGMIYTNENELISLIKKCCDNEVIKYYSEKSYNYIEIHWKKRSYINELVNLYCDILDEK